MWGSGENMEGDEGGEALVRRYCMKKSISNLKPKRSVVCSLSLACSKCPSLPRLELLILVVRHIRLVLSNSAFRAENGGFPIGWLFLQEWSGDHANEEISSNGISHIICFVMELDKGLLWIFVALKFFYATEYGKYPQRSVSGIEYDGTGRTCLKLWKPRPFTFLNI